MVTIIGSPGKSIYCLHFTVTDLTYGMIIIYYVNKAELFATDITNDQAEYTGCPMYDMIKVCLFINFLTLRHQYYHFSVAQSLHFGEFIVAF